MPYQDPQFPWLSPVNGRYEHSGVANNSSKPEPNRSGSTEPPQQSAYGTVDGFRRSLLEKGFARPNLFVVEISCDVGKHAYAKKLGMSCHAAQIPGINIATTDKDIGLRSVAYNQIYSDIILSFYCDSNMHMYGFWESWCKDIINPVDRRNKYYDDYAKNHNITIIQLNRQKNAVAKFILQEAYPKQVDPISLDYSSSGNITSLNVTITYRKAVTHYLSAESGYTHDKNTVEFSQMFNNLAIMNQIINRTGEAVAENFAGTFWDHIQKLESVITQKEKSQVGGAGGSRHNQTASSGV